jgi:hypothetical protein
MKHRRLLWGGLAMGMMIVLPEKSLKVIFSLLPKAQISL